MTCFFDAGRVRELMNRCGARRRPFLFAVNFEMTEGLFAENPLACSSVGFSVIRGGDIIGDHTVLYAGTGERIEISHRSSSRSTYAQGALRAARFLRDRQSGLFDMQTVLGLNDAAAG